MDLEIDGQLITGELQGPKPDLPYNCPKDYEDSYWVYYTAHIPGLTPGEHHVTTTFKALEALTDGYVNSYRAGPLFENTFIIIAQ